MTVDGILIGLAAERMHVHPDCLAGLDLEQIIAVVVGQHCVVRHDPAVQVAQRDIGREHLAREDSIRWHADIDVHQSCLHVHNPVHPDDVASDIGSAAGPVQHDVLAGLHAGVQRRLHADSDDQAVHAPPVETGQRHQRGARGHPVALCHRDGVDHAVVRGGHLRARPVGALAAQGIQGCFGIQISFLGLRQLVASCQLLRQQLRGVGAFGLRQVEGGKRLLIGADAGGGEVEFHQAVARMHPVARCDQNGRDPAILRQADGVAALQRRRGGAIGGDDLRQAALVHAHGGDLRHPCNLRLGVTGRGEACCHQGGGQPAWLPATGKPPHWLVSSM